MMSIAGKTEAPVDQSQNYTGDKRYSDNFI